MKLEHNNSQSNLTPNAQFVETNQTVPWFSIAARNNVGICAWLMFRGMIFSDINEISSRFNARNISVYEDLERWTHPRSLSYLLLSCNHLISSFSSPCPRLIPVRRVRTCLLWSVSLRVNPSMPHLLRGPQEGPDRSHHTDVRMIWPLSVEVICKYWHIRAMKTCIRWHCMDVCGSTRWRQLDERMEKYGDWIIKCTFCLSLH